jgi:secreted trypsin-like serine protease
MTLGNGYDVDGWCGGGTIGGRLCCSASHRIESKAYIQSILSIRVSIL